MAATHAAASARSRSKIAPAIVAPDTSAREAGLVYVSDDTPGITRRRAGRSFSYRDPRRGSVRDTATLGRIRALAIPPAWSEVWICPDARGHIQASGRDARGRKQYRYHAAFRAERERAKFDKLLAFAAALPAIRKRVERDLAAPGLPRDKVLALVVRLLSLTFIRVGNEEYARLNESFGLTTLRDRHARLSPARVEFRFRAKSGKAWSVRVCDRRLARIVKRCQDLPGEQLFQYVDEEGAVHGVDSADVNDYLRRISGGDFTAKDFRTWAGTTLAAFHLACLGSARSEREGKKRLRAAVERTAASLGNTAAICRRCYIHPAIPEAFLRGKTITALRVARPGKGSPSDALGLDAAVERATLRFLRALLRAERSAPERLERTLSRSLRAVEQAATSARARSSVR